MNEKRILKQYFDWIVNLVCTQYEAVTYSRLLHALHDIEFVWDIEMDGNRAIDGINLRPMFAENCGVSFEAQRKVLDGPCSVLEMMIALAYRCENGIMGDDEYGDRTGLWFWTMLNNIGLSDMTDNDFNEEAVRYSVERFMYHKYNRDGTCGGLFVVPHPMHDMRKTDIWYQLNWYLRNVD